MEPLTHFLTGAVLSRAGFNRKTALATLTMTLAAEAPDIDVIAYVKDPVFAFAHHRGITHTLIGTPFIAAFTLGVVWIIHRLRQRRTRKPKPGYPENPHWFLLFGLAWLATLSHILLDFTNNYGVRPLDPFPYRWYAWDIVFIIEPMLYVLLVGGLVLPSLFRLVNEEIGARERGPRGRTGAIIALIGVVCLWGLRDFEHRQAISSMSSRVYHGAEPLRVSAFPYPFNPFHWYGVVETKDWFEQFTINSLQGQVDPEGRSQVRHKPEETQATLAAKSSYLGRNFLDWARYPFIELEKRNFLHAVSVVRFKDLRFLYPDSGPRGLQAFVILDERLNVLYEGWGDAQEEDRVLQALPAKPR